jgi:hypothetical protein
MDEMHREVVSVTDFGMAILFTKFMADQGWPLKQRSVFKQMAKMQRDNPGEWFRFLAWAAMEKERRNAK